MCPACLTTLIVAAGGGGGAAGLAAFAVSKLRSRRKSVPTTPSTDPQSPCEEGGR